MPQGDSQRAGGARGGRDQFKWGDVREDKHRENYLGHSVFASKGRWQNGKDLDWYARGKKDEHLDELKEERRRIKEQEEDMMRQRLGLAPLKRKEATEVRLDQHEVKALLQRGGKRDLENESAEKGDERFDDERVGGLGSSTHARHDGAPSIVHSKMAPEDRLEGLAWEEPRGGQAPSAGAAEAAGRPAARHDSDSDESEASVSGKRRKRSREEKKVHKRERKEAKRERKEHKKAKKEKKEKKEHTAEKRQRHDSDSD